MSLKKHFKFVDIKTSILSLYAYALGSTRSAATSCKEVIIDTLSKEFKANGANVNGIQVVSGATESSNDFITYVSQLLNAAQKGSMKTTLFYWRFKIEKKITYCILAFSNASFCSYGIQHEE